MLLVRVIMWTVQYVTYLISTVHCVAIDCSSTC